MNKMNKMNKMNEDEVDEDAIFICVLHRRPSVLICG
jgi:hypothetical protein